MKYTVNVYNSTRNGYFGEVEGHTEIEFINELGYTDYSKCLSYDHRFIFDQDDLQKFIVSYGKYSEHTYVAGDIVNED